MSAEVLKKLGTHVHRKNVMALCVILVVSTTLWVARYPALYNYYLWKLDHTKWGPDFHEDIVSISPHIVPLLVRTYEDVNQSKKRRHAAAYGLIKADRKIAEDLFISFLDNKNEEIVRLAIRHLAIADSDKPFEKILEFADHPNERIRFAVDRYFNNFGNDEVRSYLIASESDMLLERIRELVQHPDKRARMAVADYLGSLDSAESRSVLSEMEANDPDERVRKLAGFHLQRLGALP